MINESTRRGFLSASTISLFIPPLQPALNANANSYATWKFYLTGTTTPAPVYASDDLSTELGSTIRSGSSGRFPNIFLDPDLTYRAVLMDANGRVVQDLDPYSAAVSTAALRASSGSDGIGFIQNGTDAIARNMAVKAREFVSVLDFGADPAGIQDSTPAIHKAMTFLMDRFDGQEDFYQGGAGDPSRAGLEDHSRRDRRTGRIHFPAGSYKVQENVFSTLNHPRSPYVGFEFVGENGDSSVLILETRGRESWFYNNGNGNERYQRMTFIGLGFRADDHRYGSFAKIYSSGGPKQFTIAQCDFKNIKQYLHTEGDGNADLNRTVFSTVECKGDFLTLDNGQSVQHDFIGTHIRCWGNIVRVKRHGGGNVNIHNGAIDFIWDDRISPREGNFMFSHDDDASIGPGNCTYNFENLRVEVEAYTNSADDPPFGLVNTRDHPNIAAPRIIFETVNFVNGASYIIDRSGSIVGEERRAINAVHLKPRKFIEFRNCILLKNFFFSVAGDRDKGSPNAGGILKFVDCFDGITTELPAEHRSLENLHSRVTYAGSAGRVITEGMEEHTTGSSFVRKLIDADPRFRESFGREPSSTKKICHFKHSKNGWPSGIHAQNDHYLDLPPDLLAIRIYVKKYASGTSSDSYQLHLRNEDRSGPAIGSSVSAKFSDEHIIDLNHYNLKGIKRLCLCASGAWSGFEDGGIAYIEYV